MSTVVAAPPAPLPTSLEHQVSPSRPFASIASAPSSADRSAPLPKRVRSNGSPAAGDNAAWLERSLSNGKISPSSRTAPPPTIKVKKEPGSPSMASSRPRPKRLDLSSSLSNNQGLQTARPSAPLTSRESAGLAIQDMGLACLSPGFQTNDPGMREQLQRSLDVRDQQRQIIEARQKGTKTGGSNDPEESGQKSQDTTLFGVQTRGPATSRRKGPPPGLSIAAPAASQFAHDRVIQSAPLNQTFTGLRPGDHAYTRHAQHGPSDLSQTSHIHHVPATQTNNRLPPIADVFANDRLDVQRTGGGGASPGQNPHAYAAPNVPSPGFPPSSSHYHHSNTPNHQVHPMSARGREYRSAEEAMAGLSGGRDDLMPKVVHYGGVQPPTPPSPMPGVHQLPPASHHQHQSHYMHEGGSSRPDLLTRTSSMNGRRRDRDEFERDNGSPPAHPHSLPSAAPPSASQFPFAGSKRSSNYNTTAFAVRGDGADNTAASSAASASNATSTSGPGAGSSSAATDDWRAGLSSAEKRAEFLRLCERAWDLFHS